MSNIRKIDQKKFNHYKTDKERIMHLLKYAILAPSTHNSQPWLFRIEKSNCEIHINPEKVIDHADPSRRDMYISIGCCLENLILAAKFYGVYRKHEITPEGTLTAKIFFDFVMKRKNKANYNNIVKTILKRRNMRGSYMKKEISASMIKSITSLSNNYPEVSLHVISSSEQIKDITELTSCAIRLAYNSESFRNEMSDWFIHNTSTKKEGIPVYTIMLPNLLSYAFPFIVKHINIGQLIAFVNRKSLKTAPIVCSFTAKNNDQKTWIQVARDAERAMLELQASNIPTSIYVAAIEVGSLSKQLAAILDSQEKPQFLFSAGFMQGERKYTPRYSPEQKIIS